VEAGLAFCLVFGVTQWLFATFLLSPAADGWFFAGGGRQWPFFLQINPTAQSSFWQVPGEELTSSRILVTIAIAVASAYLGQWVGRWMKEISA
jgi:hypothetical protein